MTKISSNQNAHPYTTKGSISAKIASYFVDEYYDVDAVAFCLNAASVGTDAPQSPHRIAQCEFLLK